MARSDVVGRRDEEEEDMEADEAAEDRGRRLEVGVGFPLFLLMLLSRWLLDWLATRLLFRTVVVVVVVAGGGGCC